MFKRTSYNQNGFQTSHSTELSEADVNNYSMQLILKRHFNLFTMAKGSTFYMPM